MNIRKFIPYPWCAARFMVAFHPFSIFGGTLFDWQNRSKFLTESAKRDGATIWWLRLGPITISYGRML